MKARSWGVSGLALLAAAGLIAGGCTRESTRIAIQTQQRADQVQQAVVEQQHEALCVLLYRDLVRRLEAGGLTLTEGQRASLSEVWNDRDLVEFWCVQNERARALRLLGVDAKLWADQSVLDLLWKQMTLRVDRGKQGLAARVAQRAAAKAGADVLHGDPEASAGGVASPGSLQEDGHAG